MSQFAGPVSGERQEGWLEILYVGVVYYSVQGQESTVFGGGSLIIG